MFWRSWLEAFRASPRGNRSVYTSLAPPIVSGGQADIIKSLHSPSGLVVAIKELRAGHTEDDRARLRREIEVGQNIEHDHIMPILDVSSDGLWFAMPWAEVCLEQQRTNLSYEHSLLFSFTRAICAGLSAAHEKGFIHRDVKPANILGFPGTNGDVHWVISDFGLVKRPAGSTTTPGRTLMGAFYGTFGFAAPELDSDAHAAVPETDVYSMGQLLGWVLTGNNPRQNIPNLPPSGPFRSLIRGCTKHNPEDRPSVEVFVEAVRRACFPSGFRPEEECKMLVGTMRNMADDERAAAENRIVQLAIDNVELEAIYIDYLPYVTKESLKQAVTGNRDALDRLVDGYDQHQKADWGRRDFGHANSVIRVVFWIARICEEDGDLNLLEKAVSVLFSWDATWDRWDVQKEIGRWISHATGQIAEVIAGCFQEEPRSAKHFKEYATGARAPAIASALRED